MMVDRFETLDGWRGISILLVLVGHLLPLSLDHSPGNNGAVASSGMALFFNLSGFLITHALVRNGDVVVFLIRRFMRIFPLAWLMLPIGLCIDQASGYQWMSEMLFVANLPPSKLTPATGHFWSLCLEVQFYIFIAVLVALIKDRAFWLLPVIGVCVTICRMHSGVELSINTGYRADEILGGCSLAMIFHRGSPAIKNWIGSLSPVFLFMLLILSAHPSFGALNYFRPYVAMALIGSTLFAPPSSWVANVLRHRVLKYLATISYALYVIHGVLSHTWLGDGTVLAKYVKRPILLVMTFVLADTSTRFYERYWISLGKKLTMKWRPLRV